MNTDTIIAIMGGLGLFLTGMVLLTDGLKSFAGRALRDVLKRFIRGPVSGVLTGAGFTALVQSSSATTLTTIGFVSAGLITFPQAIGVIFGANIGTTSTGWIVSLLGLKISLGAISPPLILLGILLRLFTRDRLASAGIAVAGFGLIFFGLEVLQGGMAELADRISDAMVPADTLGGRLLLVGIGAAMTIVMQSSSAAIAATLVAVSTGAIDFEHAAALVIGQNIGTTVTAVIAALGASTPAKRTALAHILFNVVTGAIAFAALPWFSELAIDLAARQDTVPGPAAVATFHTAFNVAGVILLLPLVRPFSFVITTVLPDRSRRLTQHLDPTVALLGAVGLEAAQRTVIATLQPLVARTRHRLDPAQPAPKITLDEVVTAIREIRTFLDRLAASSQSPPEVETHLRLLHAVDHLDRLEHALRESVPTAGQIRHLSVPAPLDLARNVVASVETWTASPDDASCADATTTASTELADLRRTTRATTLHRVATGELTSTAGDEIIDVIRWIDRVLYHIAKCVAYLDAPELPAPDDDPDGVPERAVRASADDEPTPDAV